MATTGSEGMPNAWLLEPVGGCVGFLAEELALLATVERALGALTLIPVLAGLVRLSELPARFKENLDNFAEVTKEPAEIAKQRLSVGLHTTYSNVCVSFWAAIETTIQETLINHLLQVPNATTLVSSQLPGAKVPEIVDSDSARRFVRNWETRLTATDVVERAMQMLSVFHLGFPLQEKHRRRLTELSEYRNIAVHRRGIIDARYLKKVPWCTVPIGGAYKIDHSMMIEFYEACSSFCVALLDRLTESPWITTVRT
jgi:hypothetical protein